MDPTVLEFVEHRDLKYVAISHDVQILAVEIQQLNAGIDFPVDELFGGDPLGQPVHNDYLVIIDQKVEITSVLERESSEVLPQFLT